MSQELTDRTYKIGRFTCFPISDPKLREVWAADFRDRIIHHLLVREIEPRWEKIFIHDSYACRTGKGAHRAVAKIKKILGDNQELYYLHVDIRGFFTSIDKEILFSILAKRIKHPDLVYLMKLIIFHDPKSDYLVKGSAKLLRAIPVHKSLLGAPKGKGLPIGNYTSQFFANVYLNELDQYAKRTLKCRYYFRYMDDVVILNQSSARLRTVAKLINQFLREKLKIELHPKKIILQSAGKGLDFLGYIVRSQYTLSRKRVVGNLKKKLKYFNKALSQIPADGAFREEEAEQTVKSAQAAVNSYWGHFKHADCGRLKNKIYKTHFGRLKEYLEPSSAAGGHFVLKAGILLKSAGDRTVEEN